MIWEIVGSISVLVVAVATVVGLVFIILQLRIAAASFMADHERRKKQATIDYVREVRPLYTKCRRVIDERYGIDVLSDKDVEEIVTENGEIRNNLKEILTQVEFIAIGVKTGVFDKDLWYRMSGAYMVRIYHRFRPYIKYIQKSNPNAYIEFEEVAQEFEARKRLKPDPRGNIKYS